MVGVLAGALETKVRPAVVISSSTYLVERPDVLVGILTTKAPQDDHIHGLRSHGLAISWPSRRVRFQSLRADSAPLGADRHRPSQ